MDKLIKVLNKVSDNTESIETLYVNSLLLDTLFNDLFGGATRILQSIEKTSDKELTIAGEAGLENSILSLFIKLKACLSAEVKEGVHAKSLIESELTINKKIKLCEAALEDAELILDDPSLESIVHRKYLRFKDRLSMFTITEEVAIKEMLGEKAAETVIYRWKRDQSLTPNQVQVALSSNTPFLMTGIIQIQDGLNGSTYIGGPPSMGSSRSVLAQVIHEEDKVNFLKIYWVVDKTPISKM